MIKKLKYENEYQQLQSFFDKINELVDAVNVNSIFNPEPLSKPDVSQIKPGHEEQYMEDMDELVEVLKEPGVKGGSGGDGKWYRGKVDVTKGELIPTDAGLICKNCGEAFSYHKCKPPKDKEHDHIVSVIDWITKEDVTCFDCGKTTPSTYKPTQSKDWEEEILKILRKDYSTFDELTDFIRNLLKFQRREMLGKISDVELCKQDAVEMTSVLAILEEGKE